MCHFGLRTSSPRQVPPDKSSGHLAPGHLPPRTSPPNQKCFMIRGASPNMGLSRGRYPGSNVQQGLVGGGGEEDVLESIFLYLIISKQCSNLIFQARYAIKHVRPMMPIPNHPQALLVKRRFSSYNNRLPYSLVHLNLLSLNQETFVASAESADPVKVTQ